MIVVDSSVWVPYLHEFGSPASSTLRSAVASGEVAMLDFILLELLQGARSDGAAAQIERRLADFVILAALDASIAKAAASNYRHLRAMGLTIRKVPDLIIATFCLERGHSLIHRDRDFDPFEQHLGLEVLH